MKKCDVFLSVCLSRFGIMKFVITETPRSSLIFKTIMVPLHRGRFLVVHLYIHIFSFFCGLQNFHIGANLYQKLRFFAIHEAVGPHPESQNGKI